MDLTWAYIAGFFDGEGSISVVTRKGDSSSCITVSLAQSSVTASPPPILVDIRAFFEQHGIESGLYPGKIYHGSRLTDGRTVRSNLAPWKIQIFNRAGIFTCLVGLRPYLRVKKVKCEDVLRFLALYPDRRGRHSTAIRVATSTLQAARASGLTYKQIGHAHQMSPTAVYERLTRATH